MAQKNIITESVKDSTLIEQKEASEIAAETTKSFVNLNDSENIQEEQITKENRNKLVLKFAEIEQNDYLRYKQEYSNGITIDSTKVNKAGDSFTLSINNTDEKFSCGTNNSDCTYYKGFLNSMNKYVLTNCGQSYCGTYLIDKITGDKTSLESPFDSECEAPVLSKDQNKLIAFSSSVFERKSFIALYSKSIKTEKIDFKEFDSFYTSNWKINEIIWIDTNTIALIVYDEYGGKTGGELINKRYLRGEIE